MSVGEILPTPTISLTKRGSRTVEVMCVFFRLGRSLLPHRTPTNK